MRSKYFKVFIYSLPILSFLRLVQGIWQNPDKFQQDLKVYYYAPLAWMGGQNPYTSAQFVYPPFVLPLFKIFSCFSPTTMFNVFLLAKFAGLIYLLYLWQRKILKKDADVFFYLFCILAYFGTIHLDFRAGNISIFEQLLLWSGFAFFIEKKYLPFCILIVACSLLKITPVLFLGLLLFTGHPKKLLYLIGSLVSFFVIMGTSFFLSTGLFKSFLTAALNRTDENSIVSPSIKTLLEAAYRLLPGRLLSFVPQFSIEIIYAIFIIFVVVVSVKIMRKIAAQSQEPALGMVLFYTLAYALILPRMKDYMYVLLIPATYFTIKRARFIGTFPLLFIIFTLFSPMAPTPPWFNHFYPLLWEYFPAFLALSAWGIFSYGVFNENELPASNRFC